jgi:transcriptional regulator with XRE-family HTH domain
MPVYSHLIDHEISQHVAARIRAERQRCGWTLKDLSTRVAASVATLSAVENHQVSVDTGLLFRLSEAFGTSLDALLSRTKASHFQITRRAELEVHPPAPLKLVSRKRRGVTSYHNRLWPLADAFVGKFIEPYEIEIQPIRDDELRFISHTHEEFLFVLEGRMEVLVKSPQRLIRERLGPGDCIYFWSYLPHCIRSTTRRPARSVHVLSAVDGPVDSETADWMSGPVIYMMEAPFRTAIERIADQIVSLRRARGMTAAKFASCVGISVRRLARVERGSGPLPLKLLLHICRTFRKPPDYFFAGATSPGIAHTVDRARDLRRRPKQKLGDLAVERCIAAESIGHRLAAGFESRRMFPALIELGSDRERAPRMTTHQGQEFLYVLRGEVSLTTEHDGAPVTYRLSPGDSCLLDSTAPHRYVATGTSPYTSARAEVLTVQWKPSASAAVGESTSKTSSREAPPVPGRSRESASKAGRPARRRHRR